MTTALTSSKYNWNKILYKISQYSEETLNKLCVINLLANEKSASSVLHSHIGCDSILVENLLDIVLKIRDKNLEKDVLDIDGRSYIITSVHENSYYGRLTDPSSGGIIINIVKSRNSAIITLYDSKISPFLFIPFIETIVDEIK